ncbi:MAG: hypothetical protein WAK70_08340 [Candidatus Sulfotelmatobacter sp.]
MSALPANPGFSSAGLRRVARFQRLRALTWMDDVLYASRGYELVRTQISAGQTPSDDQRWESIATFPPQFWRRWTARTMLGSRLVRDGFHALTVLPSQGMVAAVPGAIITLRPNETEFQVTHRITRGARPLHITAIPNGTVFWGEYFDNASRDEVHVYASTDAGATWSVAYTFPKGAIRHVHNIVHDSWGKCLWLLTGDYGDECRIVRASYDFRQIDIVLQGNQQARAVACVPAESGLYFSSDTPLELNYIYHLARQEQEIDRQRKLSQLAPLSSSSIYGCRVGRDIFFSTMIEPSTRNPDPFVRIFGGRDGRDWRPLLAWKKDRWPMRLFQYGNAFLPDGENNTPYLAVTTIAVELDDIDTSLYAVQP